MKNNLIRPLAIVSSLACAAVIGLAAISSTSKLTTKGFAALISRSASPVTDGSITFNGSNTSRSSATYTTASSTQTGYPIKCIARNCDPNNSGKVAALKSGTTIQFYENNGETEFVFQSLKSITFVRSNFGACNYTFSYTLDDGTDGSSGTITQGASEYNKTIDLTSYGQVTKLCVNGLSSSDTAMFSSITLTYDCGLPTKSLSSISVTTSPTKTEYVEGESFDPTGMVVTASFSDESTANVTSLCSFSPDPLELSDDEVVISYTYRGITKTTTCSVAVVENEDPTITINGTFAFSSAADQPTYNPDQNIQFKNDGTGTWTSNRPTFSMYCHIEFTYVVDSNRNVELTIVSIDFAKANDWSGNVYNRAFPGFAADKVNDTGHISNDGNTFTVSVYQYVSSIYSVYDTFTFTKQ